MHFYKKSSYQHSISKPERSHTSIFFRLSGVSSPDYHNEQELLKNLDMYLDESYDVAHDKVSRFVRIHGITKNDVDNHIREFPIAIFKYYYELRLDDVFA